MEPISPKPETAAHALGDAASMRPPRKLLISYARNFEDVLLARVFSNLERGFYVDIGAFDPVIGSVTKNLYDRGWNGINIEPGAGFLRLVHGRPRDVNLNIAILDQCGTVNLAGDRGASRAETAVEGDHAGVDTQSYTVTCDRLDRVVAEHAAGRFINLMKIDAEGSENEIVHSTDWTKVRPQVLLIKAVAPSTNKRNSQAWEDKLTTSGYKRAYFDGINLFFVRDEDADLLRHFDRPINVLDWFVKHDPVKEEALADAEELRRLKWSFATRLERLLEHFRGPSVESRFKQRELKQRELKQRELKQREPKQKENVVSLPPLPEAEELLLELEAALASTIRFDRIAAELGRSLRRWRNPAEGQGGGAKAPEMAEPARVDLLQLQQELQAAIEAATRCDRIVNQFRDPGGPRALRMVLPLGRLIRATRNFAVGQPETVKSAADKRRWGRDAQRRPLSSKLGRVLYFIVRPVVHPLAMRMRSFIIAPLSPLVSQMEALARDIEIVRRVLADAQQREQMSPELLKSIESLLFTMARFNSQR